MATMAELLKSLYEHTEGRREAESVTDFLTRFVKKDGEIDVVQLNDHRLKPVGLGATESCAQAKASPV